MRSKEVGLALGVYGLSALLAILWAVVGGQLYNLVIYLGFLLVRTPGLTPPGWNTNTLTGLSKCAIVILVAVWLGLSGYTYNHLNEARANRQLLVASGRLVLIIAAIYTLSAGLFYLLS
jgi:hypothetical protein